MPRKTMHEIWQQMLMLLGIAVAATLCIELLNRRSFVKLFLFLAYRPWMFVYDVLILLNILSVGMLFRRKFAVVTTLLTLVLVLALTNYIVICFRMQPFTTLDFLLIPNGLDIMPVYFSIFQMVLMFGGIALMLAAIVLLFIKSPRQERRHIWAKMIVIATMAVCLLGINHLAVVGGVIERRMDNLVSAYQDYGFTYCFVRTFANVGIARPSGYSDEIVEEIVTELEDEKEVLVTSRKPSKALPNIVYVQLESHFDVPAQLVGAEFSENPIPVFTELKKKWPSGALHVPSVGGGTANTEFEVLSGMNLDYFGAGEYPYNTVLSNTTCESVCYNLRAHDYVSCAVHNYLGTFYRRNTVYSQLGFDAFVPLEYIQGLQYNRQGWAEDMALVGQIIDAMDSTPSRDFVMAITVQSHGKYLDTLPEEGSAISVLACPETVNATQLENYVNELKGVDDFIAELLAEIEERGEPTVVVLYGDHLPGLGMEPEDMACGDIYQTSYIIWNNYGADFEAPDLQAYRLSANVLRQLEIDTGVLTRFHQAAPVDDMSEDYLNALEILEYDMLYGDHESTGGVVPQVATELRLGIHPIRITSADLDEEKGKLVVKGENFTESSVILVNGERLETAFVTDEMLVAIPDDPQGELRIHVAQVTKENVELGRTDAFVLLAPEKTE